MKKTYTNCPIVAEQFTDDFTPEGVMIATNTFITNVLIGSLRAEALKNGAFLFKFPKPSESDKDVARLFHVPFPFSWIKKGDYVLTYPSGYARTETKESFERDYVEIKIINSHE